MHYLNQWKNKEAIILVMSLAQNIFREYTKIRTRMYTRVYKNAKNGILYNAVIRKSTISFIFV